MKTKAFRSNRYNLRKRKDKRKIKDEKSEK